MKQKIKIVDNVSGKTLQTEVVIPNKMHLDAQIRYPHIVFKNKKHYTRKAKHKSKEW